jgi:predicted phosphodiesterase
MENEVTIVEGDRDRDRDQGQEYGWRSKIENGIVIEIKNRYQD